MNADSMRFFLRSIFGQAKRIFWISLLIGFLASGCDLFQRQDLQQSEGFILPPVISDLKIIASGIVLPEESAQLSFKESGIIEDVFVNDGDLLKSGQVIARLDGLDKVKVDLSAAEVEIMGRHQELDQLIENYELDLARVNREKLEAERRLETAINERVVKSLGRGNWNDIVIAQANYDIAIENLKEAEEKYAWFLDQEPYDVNRAETTVMLSAAMQEKTRTLNQLSWYLDGPDPLELAKSDASIAYYSAELEKKEKEWIDLQSGPDPLKISLAEARVAAAQRKLEALSLRIADQEMTAPIDGTVVVNNLKRGEVATSGTVLIWLGDLSKWRIETTDLSELDIVDVEVNDRVIVSFDALPNLEIPGVVREINRIGLNSQGDITYTVKIELLEQNEKLRWNMTATVVFE